MVENTLEQRVIALQATIADISSLLTERSGAVVILADVIARAIPIAQPALKTHLAHEIAMLRRQVPQMPHLIAVCEDALAAIERSGQ